MLGAVSNVACFLSPFTKPFIADIDIQGERGDKLHGRVTRKNSPLEQYRYGGIDRRTTWIAAHDLLHRDDGAPSVIGRDGV